MQNSGGIWQQVVMYSYRVLPTKLLADLSETAYSHSVSEVILNEKFKFKLILRIIES